MAIDFPNSPTIGQQFSAAGVVWVWDGVKWTPSGLGQAYLPLSGGTLTGPLVLNADPTIPLGAATAEYADRPRYGDNRIINGDMRINQRGVASGTAIGYTVDRWQFSSSLSTKGSWACNVANAGDAVFATGFSSYLQYTSNSAYTVAIGDYFRFLQYIEADMITDFAWGTPQAQPVTLSFWTACNQTGTLSGCIQNMAASRSYPFSFPVSGGWTKVVVTIPGDTAGTWVLNGNASSVVVQFDLGSAAQFRGPANAWASANYVGATGAGSIIAINGAWIVLTGVKLEIGSVATPYNRQSLAKSMADCQRYYQTGQYNFQGYNLGGNNDVQAFSPPVWMRASPTVVNNVSSSQNVTLGNSSVGLNAGLVTVSVHVTATAGFWYIGSYTASAEL